MSYTSTMPVGPGPLRETPTTTSRKLKPGPSNIHVDPRIARGSTFARAMVPPVSESSENMPFIHEKPQKLSADRSAFNTKRMRLPSVSSCVCSPSPPSESACSAQQRTGGSGGRQRRERQQSWQRRSG